MTEAPAREGSGRTALITGASAGIGAALAGVFAEHGFNLVLVARREERLRALAQDLADRYGVDARGVSQDLSDPEAPQKIFDRTRADGIDIDALVNNAGYGIVEDYKDTSWVDQARFMQVMATAPAHLTHLYLPGMIERDYGRIIQVASLAALMPGMAGHTLYGGVKAFLVRLAQSLSLELKDTGVHVTAICPGFTYTEYHDVIHTRKSVSSYPKLMWMTAETVARQGYDAVMEGKPVYVNGRANRLVSFLTGVLPTGLYSKTVRRQVVDPQRDEEPSS